MTNKITCLADAINHVPRVRVIKEGSDIYGQEFDVDLNYHKYKKVSIEIAGVSGIYDYSEIQFLTPVQYEGRYIGFGDKVNGEEVFNYCWYDLGWYMRSAREYDNINIYKENEIVSFEPLHKLTPKIELSTEEMIEELKRRGVVTQGNVINNN